MANSEYSPKGPQSSSTVKQFFQRGEPMIWITAFGFSTIIFMIGMMFYVIVSNGVVVFWPKDIYKVSLKSGQTLVGELTDDYTTHEGKERLQFKVGNREVYGADFKWADKEDIVSMVLEPDSLILERMEYGNAYGKLIGLEAPTLANHSPDAKATVAALEQLLHATELSKEKIREKHREIERFNQQITKITEEAKTEYYRIHGDTRHFSVNGHPDIIAIKQQFKKALDEANAIEARLNQNHLLLDNQTSRPSKIKLMDVVRFHRPNQMNLFDKIAYYLVRTQELLLDDPRESNTEGGLFPAIFGTVLLIVIMSILSFPLGVLAGIYLHEYAKDGFIVRSVRIAVNNLASIPAIVFGIFGLGFFVYGVGRSIDEWFFPERLPEPTFGTGGILWASLTLGLLTIPVVIVATEEALSAIPRAIRENSYALGATKFQTLWRICLPAASSGILTGFILAMARAAGEVAPLMITGVVKMAPSLAIDGSWPFVHLERKFMHLGFHIYDISFQSPNVEAAKPMVYVTTLLLLSIVVILSGLAIYLRERLKKKYQIQNL